MAPRVLLIPPGDSRDRLGCLLGPRASWVPRTSASSREAQLGRRSSGKPAARLVDMRDMRVYGDITSDSSAVSAVKLRSLASAFLAGDMEPEAALSGGLHFERVEAAAAAGGEKEEL